MRFELLAGASDSRGLAGAYDPDGVDRRVRGVLEQELGPDARLVEWSSTGAPIAPLVAGEVFNTPDLGEAAARDGAEMLPRLRGAFVLLASDSAGRAFLAADQTGAHSVYWLADGRRLFFASEIRLLLRLLRRRPAPNELAVIHWIANSATPPEQTLYESVMELPAGELLLFDAEGWRRRRYWAARYEEPIDRSRSEVTEELWAALRRAVELRLDDPSRVGILMSGGVDSSAVAAAAVEAAGPSTPPRGYSAVFPGHPHPRVDESERIHALVTGIGLPSTQLRIQPQGSFALSLDWLAAWELPLTGAGLVLEWPLLQAAAHDGVGALLDGQGGDEAFALSGYLLADRLLRGRLLSSFRLTRRLPGGDRQPRRRLLEAWRYYAIRGVLPAGLHEFARRARDPYRYAPDFLAPGVARRFVATDPFWSWKTVDGDAPLWWRHKAFLLVRARQQIQLGEYLRLRAAMFGLRARPPLFDVDLLEFALRVPPELEFDPGLDRPLIREAMSGRVPDAVRLSIRKSNLAPFYYDCVAGADLAPIREVLGRRDLEIGAYVKPEVVRRLVASPPGVEQPNWLRWMSDVWRLVTAECWLRSQGDPDALRELSRQKLSQPAAEMHRVFEPAAAAAEGRNDAESGPYLSRT